MRAPLLALLALTTACAPQTQEGESNHDPSFELTPLDQGPPSLGINPYQGSPCEDPTGRWEAIRGEEVDPSRLMTGEFGSYELVRVEVYRKAEHSSSHSQWVKKLPESSQVWCAHSGHVNSDFLLPKTIQTDNGHASPFLQGTFIADGVDNRTEVEVVKRVERLRSNDRIWYATPLEVTEESIRIYKSKDPEFRRDMEIALTWNLGLADPPEVVMIRAQYRPRKFDPKLVKHGRCYPRNLDLNLQEGTVRFEPQIVDLEGVNDSERRKGKWKTFGLISRSHPNRICERCGFGRALKRKISRLQRDPLPRSQRRGKLNRMYYIDDEGRLEQRFRRKATRVYETLTCEL